MLISGSAENRAGHPVCFGCELSVVDILAVGFAVNCGWLIYSAPIGVVVMALGDTEDRVNSKQLGVTRRPGSRTV